MLAETFKGITISQLKISERKKNISFYDCVKYQYLFSRGFLYMCPQINQHRLILVTSIL